jgi:catalase
MNAAQGQALFDNTARALGSAATHIQERHIVSCTKADTAYGAGVREALSRLAAVRPAKSSLAAE